MAKIFVHLADGFEEIEAITTIDVLKRAGFEVIMISVSGFPVVNGAHGISVTADELIEEADYSDVDMILLPGGMPGAKNLNSNQVLKEQIQNFYDDGKYIAAICAAPMILGEMGLLDGRNATCYPGFESHLEGAEYTGSQLEVSGNIITANGIGAALKFSLKIVELFTDRKKAQELARQMVIE